MLGHTPVWIRCNSVAYQLHIRSTSVTRPLHIHVAPRGVWSAYPASREVVSAA